MTELIYLQDSYVKEFSATVTGHDTDQNGVLLGSYSILSRWWWTAK